MILGELKKGNLRWLVKKRGLPARNITTEGFGEEKPAAPNINPDGSDNPEGRAQNRRVQITVGANF